MFNLPDLTVINRALANNSRIAPTTSNNTMVEKKNYSMGHPQRLDQANLLDLLGQLDFATSNNNSSGVIKGDSFHLTAGVLKMKPGQSSQEPPVVTYPPVAETPAEDPVVEEDVTSVDQDITDGNTEPGYVPTEL